LNNTNQGVSISYLVASSLLALKVKESVDSGRDILINKEDIEKYVSKTEL
jgi:hypothetical protein